ncbi:hypothetical protein [Salinilacihabitans rarus]|uniref:hypothetical protein n=1 Tax=Salinilacihabitans rarus TaxID=2961596 RepID=UPI0020C91628|nr:hypothetical protein [Salinilacihabitans rarus]
MPLPDPELLVESLSAVVYVVLAGVLTVGGVAAEYASLQHFGGGELTVALWMGAIGGVMLYAGAYGLGYQKVLGRLV